MVDSSLWEEKIHLYQKGSPMLSVTLDHVLKLSKRFYSHIVIVIVKGIKKLYFLLVSKIFTGEKVQRDFNKTGSSLNYFDNRHSQSRLRLGPFMRNAIIFQQYAVLFQR